MTLKYLFYDVHFAESFWSVNNTNISYFRASMGNSVPPPSSYGESFYKSSLWLIPACCPHCCSYLLVSLHSTTNHPQICFDIVRGNGQIISNLYQKKWHKGEASTSPIHTTSFQKLRLCSTRYLGFIILKFHSNLLGSFLHHFDF